MPRKELDYERNRGDKEAAGRGPLTEDQLDERSQTGYRRRARQKRQRIDSGDQDAASADLRKLRPGDQGYDDYRAKRDSDIRDRAIESRADADYRDRKGIGTRALGPQEEGYDLQRQERNKRIQNEAHRKSEDDKFRESIGLGKKPPGGGGGGPPRMPSSLGGMASMGLDAIGLPAAAALAGAAIAVQIVQAVGKVADAANRADAHGYTTAAERSKAIGEALPLSETIMGPSRAIGNYASGEAKAMGQMERDKTEREVRVAGELRNDSAKQRMGHNEIVARANYEGAKGYTAHVTTGPRQTMLERRDFEERKSQEAGLNQSAKGRADAAASERALVQLADERTRLLKDRDIAAERRKHANRLVEDEKAKDANAVTGTARQRNGWNLAGQVVGLPYGLGAPIADALFSPGNTSGTLDSSSKLKAIDDEVAALDRGKLDANAAATKARKEQLAKERGETLGGEITRKTGSANVAESRADASQSYNQQVGAQGPEGRMRAEQQAQLVKMMGGVENLSPDMYQDWAAQNPETARDKQEEVGRKLRGKTRENAPDEPGAMFDQKEQQTIADELRTQVAKMETEKNATVTKAFLDALKEANAALGQSLVDALQVEIGRIVNDKLGVAGSSSFR